MLITIVVWIEGTNKIIIPKSINIKSSFGPKLKLFDNVKALV